MIEENIKFSDDIRIGHNSNNILNQEKIGENKNRTKELFKTIEVNIKRRTVKVNDILTTFKNKPIPSWIELSLIDVCNRAVLFKFFNTVLNIFVIFWFNDFQKLHII